MIGKYIEGTPDSEVRAQQVLRRALELNPRLSVAHKFYRSWRRTWAGQGAVGRLLSEASRTATIRSFRGARARVSLADSKKSPSPRTPKHAGSIRTSHSIEQTLLMRGDIDRLQAVEPPPLVAGADDGIHVIGLGLAGFRDEARRALIQMRGTQRSPLFETWTTTSWRGSIDGLRTCRPLRARRLEDP